MSSISSQVEPYKLRSRRCRKRALEALEHGDTGQAAAEFNAAAAAMKSAIEFLHGRGDADPVSSDPATETEVELATLLADCCGMLGGVYRAEGRLDHSIHAYDQGFVYEGSPRFGILSTYNRVNRLVVRIIHTPALLSTPAPRVSFSDGRSATMRELLLEARDAIRDQLRSGRKDVPWAMADLVLVSVLAELDGVTAALRGLDESSANEPFPYQSTLAVVRDLAALDLPCREGLLRLEGYLKRRIDSLMGGNPVGI